MFSLMRKMSAREIGLGDCLKAKLLLELLSLLLFYSTSHIHPHCAKAVEKSWIRTSLPPGSLFSQFGMQKKQRNHNVKTQNGLQVRMGKVPET